ncbi:hypothetical protein A2U01_0056027, partial [Trifolium medium]|nr:hypothetical protein [Trifolium medium]
MCDSSNCPYNILGIANLSGQGLELPLSSDNHEGSKPETVTDSCTMHDTEEVNGECLSMPSVDDKCSSESKVDPTAGFCGASDVGNAVDQMQIMPMDACHVKPSDLT